MNTAWKQYVAKLCTHAWHLQSDATERVLAKIHSRLTAGVLTELAVALALYREGVSQSAADSIAPSIRLAALPHADSASRCTTPRRAKSDSGEPEGDRANDPRE